MGGEIVAFAILGGLGARAARHGVFLRRRRSLRSRRLPESHLFVSSLN